MNYLHPICFCMVFRKKGNESPILFWVWTLKCFGHGIWNLNIPHFLDETMVKPMGHGPRTFILSENLNWTKERDIQNLVIPRLVIGGRGGSHQKFLPTSHVKIIQNIKAHVFEIGLKKSFQAQDKIIHLRRM